MVKKARTLLLRRRNLPRSLRNMFIAIEFNILVLRLAVVRNHFVNFNNLIVNKFIFLRNYFS